MPAKRYKAELIVTMLRQIEVEITNGKTTLAAAQPYTPVNFDVPADACNCQTHIFGDPVRFWKTTIFQESQPEMVLEATDSVQRKLCFSAFENHQIIVFVITPDGTTIAGFYTLSAHLVNLADIPEGVAKRLPR